MLPQFGRMGLWILLTREGGWPGSSPSFPAISDLGVFSVGAPILGVQTPQLTCLWSCCIGGARARERNGSTSTCVPLNTCTSPATTHKVQLPGLPAQPPRGGAPAGSAPSRGHVMLVGGAWEGGGEELPAD